MKKFASCIHCIREGLETPIYSEEIDNDHIFRLVCSNGHEQYMVCTDHKFEILLEYAMTLYIKKDYSPAVCYFANSLERFFEFCIKVILREDCDQKIIDEELWKGKYLKFSERQLGAYVSLYVSKMKSLPILLKTDNTELRNRVIHEGYIVAKDECYNFGKDVYDIIIETLKKLREKYSGKIISEARYDMKRREKTIKDLNANISTYNLPIIWALIDYSFDSALKRTEEIRSGNLITPGHKTGND
jgi:hypothetical protein